MYDNIMHFNSQNGWCLVFFLLGIDVAKAQTPLLLLFFANFLLHLFSPYKFGLITLLFHPFSPKKFGLLTLLLHHFHLKNLGFSL
jgi:hypothetical protein